MADSNETLTHHLRAALRAAERALRLAGKRQVEAERAHRQHAAGLCPTLCSQQLLAAAAEHDAACERLAAARADLEELAEDEHERSAESDPIEPQRDYDFRENVQKL